MHLSRLTWLAAAALLVTGLTGVLAPPANAASLTQVTNFGSNPGNLAMYSYVPSGLPAGAPLVVALHGCTQNATDYYQDSGWPQFADQWHFALVFPQQNSSNNAEDCFDWYTPSDDGRGDGEAASIIQMVDYAESTYGVSPSRVYVTGLSAGAGMTADLLADYPDVFAGGSVDSGLPAQCATSLTAATNCQYDNQNLTAAQWGTLARNSDPGYSGPWPRVAIWQGSADYTVAPVNMTELMDQWTNVWGISQTASSTQSLTGGTTESSYDDAAGNPAVETYSISGMGHGLAVNPGSGATQCGATGAYFLNYICSSYYTGVFWGLNTGGGGGSGLPAPTGLAVTATTASSVSLSWSAVSGAASYDVYRNGTDVGSASSTSYTDTGLSAGTSYQYAVAAVASSGAVGAVSASVSASTTGGGGGGNPPPCFTANNYAQTQAGRAYQQGGYTYADGSNDAMGLWSLGVTTSLSETSSGYYVLVASC